MKSVTAAVLLGLVITFTGCAATQPKSGSVNVALVRHEIIDSIHGDRTVVSMGHVEHDKAVVFTRAADSTRHEETWVRGGDGAWTLSGSAVVAGN